jgi:ABC-type sugar transport system permease subunit
MTRGGPGISNTPITLYIYNNAFRYFKMGKASAIAVLLGVVVMLLTFLQLKIFGDEQED